MSYKSGFMPYTKNKVVRQRQKHMSDNKIMLNFRCPVDVLQAIDRLGAERYPANTKHGCDRSKTLMDIIRAGINALGDGEIVLPQESAEVRQQTDNRKTGIDECKATESVRQEIANSLDPVLDRLAAMEERLGKLSA
jgi:predicted ATPase